MQAPADSCWRSAAAALCKTVPATAAPATAVPAKHLRSWLRMQQQHGGSSGSGWQRLQTHETEMKPPPNDQADLMSPAGRQAGIVRQAAESLGGTDAEAGELAGSITSIADRGAAVPAGLAAAQAALEQGIHGLRQLVAVCTACASCQLHCSPLLSIVQVPSNTSLSDTGM